METHAPVTLARAAHQCDPPSVPRVSRKKLRRIGDQGDWSICIAWKRMYVALQNAGFDEADLRLPITVFLSESRAVIANCPPPAREHARELMQEAWEALGAMDTWRAAVRCMEARSAARENPTLAQEQIEGIALCDAIREVYPTAPTGFERVGRSSRQEEG